MAGDVRLYTPHAVDKAADVSICSPWRKDHYRLAKRRRMITD
jgi:hypothetical protein